MRTLLAILASTAMLGLGGQAVAESTAKNKRAAQQERVGIFKAADVNHDGMLSRQEFMNFHEAAWQRTKRNSSDMAMMADVEATYRAGTVPSRRGRSRRRPSGPATHDR